MKIRIGTRKSRLAMVQTELVRVMILDKFPEAEIELVPMSTRGDKIQDRSLASLGGKGVFTRELEDGLLAGEVDMAVHSAKDLPMDFPAGLTLGAVLERGHPGDVLVTRDGTPAKELPAGSIIGTGSLRRELQIRRLNPQVRTKLLRGNVQTRLAKLKAGGYDGILLAAAGLERLGLCETDDLCLEYLNPEEFIPAAGQGILAVEIRQGELAEVMAAIHSEEAAAMLAAERKYLTLLGGSCNAPCGAYCRLEKGQIVMNAMYAADGVHPVFRKKVRPLGAPAAPAGAPALMPPALDLAGRLAAEVGLKTVSLVGAGPGDSGLLTGKGLACVRRAEVIIYDNLISGSILNEAPLDAALIYAGKRSDNHHLPQEQINALLVEEALKGRYVVRLKGGDPYVFGRGGEEARELQKHGIPFEIVPGVSSSYSVPAYAGIPVTQRDLASSVHVITGHEGAHKKETVLDYAVLAKTEGTLVFLMGLKNLRRIAEQLMLYGKPAQTPVAVIQQGTTARQKKVVSTLGEIEAEVRRLGIRPPAVTVVGDVVPLAGELDWFGKGPLAGRRVLITGSRHMVKELEQEIAPLGGETVAVSLIEARPLTGRPLKQALQALADYSWLVFTSANGVKLFFEALQELQVDLRRLMHVKFAVIGRKTGGALRRYGFQYDFAPENDSGEDLANEWIPVLTKKDRILMLRALEGTPVLPERLTQAGISFTDLPVYETWVDERRKEELNRIVPEVDYITLASASAAKAFARMTGGILPVTAKMIAIGPATAAAAEAEVAGLKVCRSGTEYTAAGMAAAILADVLETANR